jgi:hypothetical protein
MSGKLLLLNGHSVKGDITKTDDGGYWLTTKHGSVKYDKLEIKKVIIYSDRDMVSERFMSSMRITPGTQQSAVSSSDETQYDNLIRREAERNNIDPALVKAVIKAESGYNSRDVSCKGACGLMQLMPKTAKGLGVKKIFSPQENIAAGTRFLRYMIDAFDGDLEMGLAAYNAGAGAVKKYGTVPPYKETKNYVNNVFRFYRRYGNSGRKIASYTDEKGCLTIYNER